MKIKVEELTALSGLITQLVVTVISAAQAAAQAAGKKELTIEELEDFVLKPNQERLARWKKKAGIEE